MAADAVGNSATEAFVQAFGYRPTGVWSAPGRANLIGEHIDYAGGTVLPFALPYVTAAAVSVRADGVVRCVSTHEEQGWEGPVDQVAPGHPTGWASYVAGVLWVLATRGLLSAGVGFDIAIASSVPIGSGLSSSAALECSVALAVAELTGLPTTEPEDRLQLVTAAIRAENEIAGASTGGMDQSVSMLARSGSALLLDCRTFAHSHIPLDPARSGAALMLIDSNTPHQLVGSAYTDRRADIDTAAERLGVASLRSVRDVDAALARLAADGGERLARRARHVLSEMRRVELAVEAMQTDNLRLVGELLSASHASLRDDYEVSTSALDAIVAAALDGGAWGARMIGGGFGGCALVLCAADREEIIAAAVAQTLAAAEHPTPSVYVASPGPPARRLQ
ncbi:galactokinase [Williamsia sp. CHRR-6]|nr:galactokinase [Williamsia sp. CHRR-6]